ncbi:fused MFS/spermidine synthase [Cryptosporangium arvum]|uniref:Spermidine synthase n=1 Tax=Cryptosporangium arvum DSM 44712 TaxID=927661 RepID=A0A010ZLM7_9ACTN|nr:fused MFS/spermidine synthase [Cryptosporangium arvum]EXG79569.1 spermidine synthase [Cryptosporangium arvum DSM 44712]
MTPPDGRWQPGPVLAGILVVLASGAVLVLEILSLRLIAPYVGVTLETNTAVIGVALAAIAVGAWAGGAVADRLPPAVLLGPLLLGAGALVFAVTPVVRFVGELVQGADASGVLLVAAAAVFAPAALLSAVPPIVVKARLANLSETGTVVGRLSGLGTVGSIVATFGTGFIAVAMVPTTTILTGLAVLLVVTGLAVAWISRGASRLSPGSKRGLAGPLALALIGAGATAAAPNPCELETVYHCASVSADPDRPDGDGRVLRLDTLRHSYVDLKDPTYLQFEYLKVIGAATDVFRPPGAPVKALHLGGGGLTLPRYLKAVRPGSDSLVYEIDAGVLRIDREQLGLREGDGIRTRVEDARVGLDEQRTDSYDLVVGDAFGGVAVPWHLTTRQVVAQVDRALTPTGMYAVNLIDHGSLAFVKAEVATISAVFPHVALIAETAAFSGAGGNLVVLASASPLPLAALKSALATKAPAMNVVTGGDLSGFIREAKVLTDDFAPVDQLVTPYRS